MSRKQVQETVERIERGEVGAKTEEGKKPW